MPIPVPFAWPDFFDGWRVPDQAFSDAYASLSDFDRSWIKKNIAQLYALHPPNRFRSTNHRTDWTVGFQTRNMVQPRPWAVVLLPAINASPARTLAALLPAMTAGIPKILVVLRQQAGWDALLLTSLELCGVEVVCHMDDPTIRDTLRQMTELNANGTILALDDVGTPFPDAEPAFAGSVVWRLQAQLPIRIWHDTPDEWEWDVLLRNHPATPMEVWGPLQGRAPNPFQPISGTWEQFCRDSRLAIGVGSHLLSDTAIPSNGLLFTPGQEGCWFWPNLPSDLFFLHGMVLAGSDAYP